MLEIRAERPDDAEVIYALHAAAFGREGEAELVRALRERGELLVSLVAEAAGAPAGHIAFSPVTVPGPRRVRAAGLGPLAVAPERQGEGVGSALVRTGHAACRARRLEAVFVLGHPGFYRRFGFAPAARYGLYFQSHAFDAAFFALELRPGALASASGEVGYPPPFYGA